MEQRKFLVYGDYSIEKKGIEEFRNDFKVLGIIKAKDLEKAQGKLISECAIDNINDIDGNEVHIVEIVNENVLVLKNL